MKKTIALFALSGSLLTASLLPAHAADAIAPIQGRLAQSSAISNSLGRAYDVTAIYINPGVANVTNVVAVSVKNWQNTDTTGTNATIAAVTYAVGSATCAAATVVYTPSAGTLRVPKNGSLILSTASGTNDYFVIRNEAQ